LDERKHWLNDDYVKFFRFSEQIINNNNEGILAFVSNNGYLDNNTFRGMRASLLRTFDEIYIVNLHGSANKQETAPNGSKDENVFNIMQGVALFIGVKTTSNPEWAKVYYCDLWGTREDKFQHLDDEDIDFKEIKLDQRMAYFVPYGNDDKELYEKGINIAELFPVNVTGIVSGNDNAAISSSRIELQDRIAIVKNATEETPVLNLWRKFSRGQSAEKICNDVLDPDGIITPISFRPFDERWTYYTGNSCGWLLWPREKKTMGHLLAPPSSPIEQNIGLVFCKTSRSFFSPFVSTHIIAHRLFSAMCEITYIAPLYKRTDTMMEGEVWEANLNAALYSQLTQNLSVPPSPIEVFDYVYGILHDPIYCSRFNEFLTRNFPKVPVINAPEDRENQNSFYVSEDLFRAYVTAGARLRKLHIMLVKVPATLTIEPNTPDNLDIGRIQYRNKELSLNEKKHIVGIPEDVWNYNIGGYQVLANWFKSHIGESMTRDNFNHIENIVGLLTETITIQDELRGLH